MLKISAFRYDISVWPGNMIKAALRYLWKRYPQYVLEVIGHVIYRDACLDNMVLDLSEESDFNFEHLAGLFSSNNLNRGATAQTIRMAAYTYGLIRSRSVRKIIEIGRYKGGTTLLMAVAMRGGGEIWSVDSGDKERRLHQTGERSFDIQLADKCKQYNIKTNIHMMVGDSRVIEFESGEVDLVYIDGDHAYETVKNDFERFGRRVRVGGIILFDDVFDEGVFKTSSDTVGKLVQEIVGGGEYRLVRAVNRMAHVERTR